MLCCDAGVRVEAIEALTSVAEAEFDAVPVDPFFNVNHADDLAAAHDMLARAGSQGR